MQKTLDIFQHLLVNMSAACWRGFLHHLKTFGSDSESLNCLLLGLRAKSGRCVDFCVCWNACRHAAACIRSVCDRRRIWQTLSPLSPVHNQEALNRVRQSLQGSRGHHINHVAANKRKACWRFTQELVALKTPLTQMPGEWRKKIVAWITRSSGKCVWIVGVKNNYLLLSASFLSFYLHQLTVAGYKSNF